MESGAPDEPLGSSSKEDKCCNWLKRCNEDFSVDALAVLGQVIQKFMDQEPSDWNSKVSEGQTRIRNSLAKNQRSYQSNGFITLAGTSLTVKTLTDFFKARDFASVEAEFDRAIKQIESDPHAAITAASSIIEALEPTSLANCLNNRLLSSRTAPDFRFKFVT